jgi:hypothetical protein
MIIKRLKTNMRGAVLAFAAFVVALSGVAAMNSTPASAMSGTCASNGYSLVGTQPIYMRKADTTIVARTGTLEVYYKSSTGKNCAMAKCTGNWCFTMYRWVGIRPSSRDSGWDEIDAGNFSSYAGGVDTTNSTRGKCIDVDARFGGQSQPNDAGYGHTYLRNAYCG